MLEDLRPGCLSIRLKLSCLPGSGRETFYVIISLQVESKITLESCSAPDSQGCQDHGSICRGCDVLAQGFFTGRGLGFPFATRVAPSSVES